MLVRLADVIVIDADGAAGDLRAHGGRDASSPERGYVIDGMRWYNAVTGQDTKPAS